MMKLQAVKSTSWGVGCCILLLPWILIIGYTSPLAISFVFLAVIVGLFGLGHTLIETTKTRFTREDKILFSLPTGYLAVCGIIALAVRLSMSPSVIFWVLTVLALLCLILSSIRKSTYRLGKLQGFPALAVLSFTIAFLYFLPGAVRDAVYLPNGSYNWMHVDTQYFYAIAANVKTCIGAPKWPGVSFLDLSYHFGPYAVAGALSAALDISIGDALVRVFRPIALLSLFLAAYATGRYLGRGAGHESTGGILAVAGLFFYGSIGSLFSSPASSSLVSGAILFKVPYVDVLSNGGPFAHIVLGHSQVHGLSGLLVLTMILLDKLRAQDERSFQLDSSTFGPAILFPTSIVLGFAFLGLYSLLFAWFGARYKRVWLTLSVAVGAAIFSVWSMGYINLVSSGHVGFASLQDIREKFFPFFIWFYIGLGIRLFAFTRLRNPFRDPFSAVLIVLFSGFVLLRFLCREFDSRYGFLYAQGVLSVFSFALLSSPLHAALSRSWSEVFLEAAKFLHVVFLSSLGFLSCAALLYGISLYRSDGMGDSFYTTSLIIRLSFIVLLLGSASLVIMARAHYLKTLLVAFMACVYLFGFTAWTTDWINYGLGRLKMDVTIERGVVQGLQKLRGISGKGDFICTNQHTLTGYYGEGLERSYAYGALSERPILVEGWAYAGVKKIPEFNDIYKDNELVFTSSQPEVVRSIINKYGIRYIIQRPDTSLRISGTLPCWLQEVSGAGSLKIYAVTY